MAGNGWKELEMARNGWNWLEMEGIAGNDWKLIKMTRIMLENQMGRPYHSFDCVLYEFSYCRVMFGKLNH